MVSDYHVFVTFKKEEENKRPDFYIVPSKFVVDYIKKTHRYWANLPSGDKEKRMKCDLRCFPNYIGKKLPEFKDYNINTHREKWDLLDP